MDLRRYYLLQTVAISCLLLLLVGSTPAENWPNWRGPRQDGINLESKLPAQWSEIENTAWRVELPGAAGATPILWEDRIFLTSAEGDDLVLLCISTSGDILWKRTVGTGNRSTRGGEGNYASPSPTTDGHHVWVFFSNGNLACYDFEGNQVWATNLQERYGEFKMFFVMSSTPVLDGDRLYLQLIHGNAAVVLALDKTTGDEIWKHDRHSDASAECEHSYASPIIYRDDERQYLLVHGADYITAHDLDDGSEIWRCGGINSGEKYHRTLRFVASPVAIPGLIVVPSAKRYPVLGLKPDGQGDITEVAEAYHWKRPGDTPDVPSPLVYDGLVYLCGENGGLICMDAVTGEEIYWEKTHRAKYRASPIYADGKIYLTARDGMITVVKAGREFKALATNNLGETIAASPIVANNTLYLRSYEALYAIKVAQ